jgi:hypothetical protein
MRQLSPRIAFLALTTLLSAGAGWALSQDGRPASESPAQDSKPAAPVSENAARFERLKGLAGTWKSVARHGEDTMEGEFHYKVTAAGSAVVETLFVGTPHEMVTVYTLSGDDLVLTHYCAMGNQPRMKAEKGGDANTIKFAFDTLQNGDPAKDMHMHEGVLSFVGDTRIRAEYQGWEGGKPAAGHKAMIELERVK